MSRHDGNEFGLVGGALAFESQRGGGYDPGTRSHNFFNGLPPLSIPDGHSRTPQSAGLVPGSTTIDHHHYHHHRTMSGNALFEEQGFSSEPQPSRARLEEMWTFPPPESAFQVEGVWARNGNGAGTTNEPITNTVMPRPVPLTSPSSTNAHSTRVASSVSPFNLNHNHRATYSPSNNGAATPSASAHNQTFALNGNSAVYPSFLSEHSRETEALLLQQQSQALSAQLQVLPQQQQQIFDSQFITGRSASLPNTKSSLSHSTLWWGELEPWMDEEYAKQVCGLMGWDQVSVKIPSVPSDSATGQQGNNPGYCFLTFPSPQNAAAVLSQVNAAQSNGPLTMPNSNKSFVLNWASSPAPAPATPTYTAPTSAIPVAQSNPNQQKEYSIFVGDLAPETSNSDLVAVFRNPVLGLRNDRAPKFIRPFYSVKSAKIMLDPVTGVSRGYGFVRFTDEADQQRALIEMHGLYCLSRPMRISPATAKYKGPPDQQPGQQAAEPTRTGNVPASSVATSRSGSSIGSSSSIPSLSSSTTASSVSTGIPSQPSGISIEALAQFLAKANIAGKDAAGRSISSITAALVQDQQKLDESWKHQVQARAILSNLIGPNGEQLSSTDPYNTTVFVGGLSPLISEETLRTFFAPFGDIHYVKVPAGKHCGFVQFVRKADAERAIERMQGFPIGGSRIRLSWGRSQYKAAQAAAQAAAHAQAQALQTSLQLSNGQVQLTAEQAIELLHKFGFGGPNQPSIGTVGNTSLQGTGPNMNANIASQGGNIDTVRLSGSFNSGLNSSTSTEDRLGLRTQSVLNFSPFSPDPNFGTNERGNAGNVIDPSVPRTLSTYGQRFGNGSAKPMADLTSVGNGRLSPVNSTGSARSPTPSQQTPQGPQQQEVSQQQAQTGFSGNSLGFVLNRSAAPFQLGRVPNASGASSRPSSSQPAVPIIGPHLPKQQEPVSDMNSTLATLDHGAGAMNTSASSINITSSTSIRSPGEKSDSSGSVQFKLTMGSPDTSPQP